MQRENNKLCIITVLHQRSLIIAQSATHAPSSPPHLPLHTSTREGSVKPSEASNEAPAGAGYTIEPLWGNRLAHFKGQKGACLSKESPLFTFIADMQSQSAENSFNNDSGTCRQPHKLWKPNIHTSKIHACGKCVFTGKVQSSRILLPLHIPPLFKE